MSGRARVRGCQAEHAFGGKRCLHCACDGGDFVHKVLLASRGGGEAVVDDERESSADHVVRVGLSLDCDVPGDTLRSFVFFFFFLG